MTTSAFKDGDIVNIDGTLFELREFHPRTLFDLDSMPALPSETTTEKPATVNAGEPGGAVPGPTTAECDTEPTGSADAPQVPEAAGGGGSEGATENTQKGPTVDPEAAARVGTLTQRVEQSRPDPASNGADRGGAAGGGGCEGAPAENPGTQDPPPREEKPPLAYRLRACIRDLEVSQTLAAELIGVSPPTIRTLLEGTAGSTARRKCEEFLARRGAS